VPFTIFRGVDREFPRATYHPLCVPYPCSTSCEVESAWFSSPLALFLFLLFRDDGTPLYVPPPTFLPGAPPLPFFATQDYLFLSLFLSLAQISYIFPSFTDGSFQLPFLTTWSYVTPPSPAAFFEGCVLTPPQLCARRLLFPGPPLSSEPQFSWTQEKVFSFSSCGPFFAFYLHSMKV